jgi:hypothetical protein
VKPGHGRGYLSQPVIAVTSVAVLGMTALDREIAGDCSDMEGWAYLRVAHGVAVGPSCGVSYQRPQACHTDVGLCFRTGIRSLTRPDNRRSRADHFRRISAGAAARLTQNLLCIELVRGGIE